MKYLELLSLSAVAGFVMMWSMGLLLLGLTEEISLKDALIIRAASCFLATIAIFISIGGYRWIN